jgi:hypothetical protein
MQRILLSAIAGSVFCLVSLSAVMAAPQLPTKPVTATILTRAGSVGGVGGVSAGSPAAVGLGAMSSGGVGGVGSVGARPGNYGKLNHPGPSVIWYPPEYSAKKQRRADQSCQWLYQKAKTTGTRYWRSRYNNCIAMR